VLDAGCGTGPFIPLLRELVGESGEVVAVDTDAAMIAAVQTRAASEGWRNVRPLVGDACRLESMAELRPSFDAIWCANVTQYMEEAALEAFLASSRRVLRPGGLLALKEFEGDALRVEPLPAGLLARWHDARCDAGVTHARALRRTASMATWLAGAGYESVHATPTEMLRHAPLDPAMRRLMRSLFEFLAAEAATVKLCTEDRQAWARLAMIERADHPLQDANFHYRAVQWTVVGSAPAMAGGAFST